MAVRTETVTARRAVHFASFTELSEEVDQVVHHHERGDVHTAGTWTAGQILQHVGKLIAFSLDGFPFTIPWPTRLVCTILKWVSWKYLLRLAFRPGHQLPATAAALLPDPEVSVAEGAAHLRGQIERVRRGEKMLQPSPFEGRITHEQWVEGHLRHAELHFSFLHYGPAEG